MMTTLRAFRSVVTMAIPALCGMAAAQVTVFDASTNRVTIPSVTVGDATYTNVTLQHDGDFVFTLQGATEQKPAGAGVARYDTTTNLLSIPAVQLGSDTYVDVTLLNTGNFVFSLQAATLLPPATLGELQAVLSAFDALWATAVPARSALASSFNDACYRQEGRDMNWLSADWDKDLAMTQAAQANRVGAVRSNLQVLAQRSRSNPDGSTRREVDVQYDVGYKDGSVAKSVTETLISGSSAGTAGCSTAQTGSGWRFFGNQRLVGFSLQARVTRDERYAISTGLPLSPAVRYRRDMRVRVTDPLGNASYIVVSGPGPGATIDGVAMQWSWKMVSPRLMRSAPELAGKSGNYTNALDEDSFRYCGIAGTGTPVASASDCLTFGAQGDNWGIGFTATPDAAADDAFTNQGWQVGGAYRVDVYNDDGWKTINGHAGKTPIATYFETLKTLPRSFVEMAGSIGTPTSNDRFAHLDFGALGAVGVRDNAFSATPSPFALSWTPQPPLSATQPFGLRQGWEYFEGLKTDRADGSSWPRLRSIEFVYPAVDATSFATWPAQAAPADITGRSYFEYMLYHSDRSQSVIQSRVTFQ